MKFRISLAVAAFTVFLSANSIYSQNAKPVRGWLSWRGPNQNGTSLEKNLPDTVDPENPLWVVDSPGQSTPVIANGKLYIMSHFGTGPDLQEGVACFDAETGKKIWQRGFNDFLSDIIYERYASSSPAIDSETGNVYMQGTQGILAAFTSDGKPLWKHSLMEKFGRLTFPNGRTASPIVDGDLVITRGITANWGAQGPGGDRFYAFDKKSGHLVWSSTPANRPKDSCFSYPYIGWRDGKRVLYATMGDGSVVGVNARTGDPLWRVTIGKAGINSSVLVHNNDKVIAIYGTPYEPGQMVALKIPKVTSDSPSPLAVERSDIELWNNDLSTSTSSPILVGDKIYVVSEKGDLCSVDVNTGKVLWRLKIGIEQRNASPLFADGKIYVPMLEDPGSKSGGGEAGAVGAFYIVEPSDTEGKILTHVSLDGRCFGSPTVYNGKVYVQTTRKLYAFGEKNKPAISLNSSRSETAKKLNVEEFRPIKIYSDRSNEVIVERNTNGVESGKYFIPNISSYIPNIFGEDGFVLTRVKNFPEVVDFGKDLGGVGVLYDYHRIHSVEIDWPNAGPATQLQIIPSEVTLRPAQSQAFRVRSLDKNGFTVEEIKDVKKVKWASFVPPTAKVRSTMNAKFDEEGELVAETNSVPSAGAFEAKLGDLKGYIRGRVLPYLPVKQDFEWAQLTETTTNNVEEPTKFAYPPLPWIGARFKFEVREKDGSKVLTKTIDNSFFQRATVFMGDPNTENYTIEADVMSEGNRRKMSDVGIICQRYLIVLKGNEQKLEINSNLERLRVPATEEPSNFKWSPNVWYQLKATVDNAKDGSGVVRAKAWKRGEPEPEKWTLELPHKTSHQTGSPGLFGFSPQDMRVFIDNISVTPN